MRVCLMIEGQEGVTWPQWLALAEAAENAGLDALFRSDHYRSIALGDPAGSLDAWAVLAALASHTQRIRLGTLVSPVTFRHVSVLAKNVVTVDHISQGRVELGIGAGWYEAEHQSYGFAFGTARNRVDELDTQLAELVRQWTRAAEIWPKPVQQPRPRIIVGGRGKPRTLAAAVRFADEYNSVFPTLDEAEERASVLRHAARDANREPLTLSMMLSCVVGTDSADVADRLDRWRGLAESPDDSPHLIGTVDEVAAMLIRYRSAGIERVMLQHLDHEDLESVALFGALAGLLTAD